MRNFRLLLWIWSLLPVFSYAQDVQNFEENPDYYSCGLRRVSQDGLVGFVNKKKVVVIQPQFNYAHPFLKKRCLALKGASLEETSMTDSEESTQTWKGGLWGVIDAKGKALKPFMYQRKWNADMGEFVYISEQDSFYVNAKGKILELK